MQATGLMAAGRRDASATAETWTETAAAWLLLVVVAALCAASYLGWMLLTEPVAVLERIVGLLA